MYDALLTLFNFFIDNFYTPLADALNNSGLFELSSDFISKFLTSFFKLWNNDNSFIFSSVDIVNLFAEIICFLLLVFCLWFVLKIFISIYNIISKGLSKC